MPNYDFLLLAIGFFSGVTLYIVIENIFSSHRRRSALKDLTKRIEEDIEQSNAERMAINQLNELNKISSELDTSELWDFVLNWVDRNYQQLKLPSNKMLHQEMFHERAYTYVQLRITLAAAEKLGYDLAAEALLDIFPAVDKFGQYVNEMYGVKIEELDSKIVSAVEECINNR